MHNNTNTINNITINNSTTVTKDMHGNTFNTKGADGQPSNCQAGTRCCRPRPGTWCGRVLPRAVAAGPMSGGGAAHDAHNSKRTGPKSSGVCTPA